jgi:hypothetical protein
MVRFFWYVSTTETSRFATSDGSVLWKDGNGICGSVDRLRVDFVGNLFRGLRWVGMRFGGFFRVPLVVVVVVVVVVAAAVTFAVLGFTFLLR